MEHARFVWNQHAGRHVASHRFRFHTGGSSYILNAQSIHKVMLRGTHHRQLSTAEDITTRPCVPTCASCVDRFDEGEGSRGGASNTRYPRNTAHLQRPLLASPTSPVSRGPL
jgi:hypothetical protein